MGSGNVSSGHSNENLKFYSGKWAVVGNKNLFRTKDKRHKKQPGAVLVLLACCNLKSMLEGAECGQRTEEEVREVERKIKDI